MQVKQNRCLFSQILFLCASIIDTSSRPVIIPALRSCLSLHNHARPFSVRCIFLNAPCHHRGTARPPSSLSGGGGWFENCQTPTRSGAFLPKDEPGLNALETDRAVGRPRAFLLVLQEVSTGAGALCIILCIHRCYNPNLHSDWFPCDYAQKNFNAENVKKLQGMFLCFWRVVAHNRFLPSTSRIHSLSFLFLTDTFCFYDF